MPIKRHADNIIQYIGPTKTIDSTQYLDASDTNTDDPSTCIARIYDEQKQCSIAPATTRLRTEVAASATTWLIPHIVPQWIEASDEVTIVTSEGQLHRTVITSMTPGTDAGTAATNFDTIVVATAATAICSAGAVITLTKKDSTATVIPIRGEVELPNDDDTVEIQTNTEGSPSRSNAITLVRKSYATEDGSEALNQEEAFIMTVGSTLAVDASVNRIVRVQLGSEITMAEYGTPVAGSADWGFVGTFADDFAGLDTGSLVRIEIIFNDAVNPGLRDVEYLVEPVNEG